MRHQSISIRARSCAPSRHWNWRLRKRATRRRLFDVSLNEIKDAIVKLSVEERAELNRLLYGWEDDEWDKQMAEDAAAGRLDDMIKRAESDMANGRCREL